MRLQLYLIKPTQYDDEGYVVRHWRGVLPSNTLACLAGLTEDVVGQKRLTVQMTMRYVHPTDAHKVEAAKKLEMYNAQAVMKLAQETSRVATISATVN